jgi:hypothetical protein
MGVDDDPPASMDNASMGGEGSGFSLRASYVRVREPRTHAGP